METPSLTVAVRRELLAHPDVTEATHRFGGIVFHLGRHEIGHLHGETVADLPIPRHVRHELVAAGRLSAAHIGTDPAWMSRRVDGPQDVAEIVALFRISLERAAAQAALAGDEDDREEAAPAAGGPPRRTWRDALGMPARRTPRRRH